jgi:hypothetical protein
MRILGSSKRSGSTPAVFRVVILAILLQGPDFAQTTTCTLSNGTVNGPFGGYDVSGSFSGPAGAVATTSSITVNGPGIPYSYTFTGPLNGAGYVQPSQLPPTPCDILGCTPGTVVPLYASLHVAPNDTNTSIALAFTDTGEPFNGLANLSCTTAGSPPPPPPPPVCGVYATLTGNGTPSIDGIATPTGGVTTLSAAASACGYKGFNWQQFITYNVCPSASSAAVPSVLNECPGPTPTPTGIAAGGPQINGVTLPPVSDYPPGGWSYLTVTSTGQPLDPYPYYYLESVAITPNGVFPQVTEGSEVGVPDPINIDDMKLLFYDRPSDPCLPTGPLTQEQAEHLMAVRSQACGGTFQPAGSYIGFQTFLVGVNMDDSPGPPLFQWTWQSTFNGTVGGIGGLSGLFPVDPNSGAGYVTITSINGVAVPPIIPPTQVSTTASGLAYSRVTKTFNGTVTIKNTSGTTLTTATNFQLVLNSLPAGVTLANSVGTFNQCPYLTIPTVRSLAPGQSVTVAVQFSNPSNATINFTPEFYAGSFQ